MKSITEIVSAAAGLLLWAGCGTLQVDFPSECPVHKTALQRDLVPIRSGAPRQEYLNARDRLFPFSGTVFSGNVDTAVREPMTAAPVCGVCRQEERRWIREHRWSDAKPNAGYCSRFCRTECNPRPAGIVTSGNLDSPRART